MAGPLLPAAFLIRATMLCFLSSRISYRQLRSSATRQFSLTFDERNLISSPQSKSIKTIQKLLRGRKRSDASTVVEGPRSIIDLLVNPSTRTLVEQIVVDVDRMADYGPQLEAAVGPDNRLPHVLPATSAVLKACADTVTTQGIVAKVLIPESSLETVKEAASTQQAPLFLVGDGVSDPGNLGTLIRSAAATAASGIFLIGGCDPWNPKTVRASMGTAFLVPILYCANLDDCRSQLEQVGCQRLFACTMLEESVQNQSIYDVDWTAESSAVMIGSEGNGLSNEVRFALEEGQFGAIHVPTEASVESLNAGVCGSLVLFEAYRQRLLAE